ncbi:MAG: MBL fold metallo-hydrolase [Candidatus Altiarchaeota archaeon]
MRLTLIVVALILACGCVQKNGEAVKDDLVVQFIQVRTGDAILIQTPEGANILIDGGISVDALDYLRENGITRLDAAIATHLHADQVLGLWRIIEGGEVKVGRFYHNNDSRSVYFQQVRDLVNENPNTLERGDELSFGELTLKVLWPPSNNPQELAQRSDNDNSIVLKLVYGNFSMLLTGDCEQTCERELVKNGGLRANVLKAGHHGLPASSLREFLEAVDPGLIVVPGHVRESVFLPKVNFCSEREWIQPFNENINESGVKTLNVKFDGTVTLTTNGVKYYYVNYAGKEFEECPEDIVMEKLAFATYNYSWGGADFSVELYPRLLPAATWVRENTPKDAVFLNWWDASHMIRGVGGRDTVIYGPSREILHTVSKYAALTDVERARVPCPECNPHERITDVVDALITFGAENTLDIMDKYESRYVFVTEDDKSAIHSLLLIDGRNPEEFLDDDSHPNEYARKLILHRMIEGEYIRGFTKIYSDQTVRIYETEKKLVEPEDTVV